MSILTIIPARSGSKRLPGKNWEKVGGKTLLQHALDDALGDLIVIATDAPEKCMEATRSKNVCIMEEPAALADDSARMSDVVRWVCEGIENDRYRVPRRYDAVMVLQPSSPLRTPGDVLNCVSAHDSLGWNSLVSVVADLETKSYKRNGAIYITDWQLAARGDLMGGLTHFYVMPPERSIDINTAEDLAEARRLAGD